MIRIAISQAAFDAIAATLLLGSVGYENATNERGERFDLVGPPRDQRPARHAEVKREPQRAKAEARITIWSPRRD
jgi:hypothetical protein